jgi:RNA polymerase sigma factor (sigma-70 family)
MTDGQLLEKFVEHRDEAAFEAIVRLHGPMVFGVCRRILGRHHDAEEAFQATFLVLARRAASLSRRESLANWLYGVAQRTALKARGLRAKRQLRERQTVLIPKIEDAKSDQLPELELLLDAELQRLPAKYREPLVLCELEGRSCKDVALQLGCPEGTLFSRLARARAMLAKRLTRRGLVLSAGPLVVLLSRQAESALPDALVASTVKAAAFASVGHALAAGVITGSVAALAEGVMKSILFTKLTAIAVLIGALGLVAAGGLLYRNQAAEHTKVTLEDVLSAWRKRDARVRSMSFKWDSQQFTGSAALKRGHMLDHNGLEGPPEADRTSNVCYRFVSDGRGRMRFEERGQAWLSNQTPNKVRTFTDVFDGHREQVFLEHASIDFPNANFKNKKAEEVVYNRLPLLPLQLVYRGVQDPVYDTDGKGKDPVVEKRWPVVGKRTEVVDKHVAVVLTFAYQVTFPATPARGPLTTEIVRSVWVDPARDFVPLQYTETTHGFVRTFVRIAYTKDADLGWVPQSWTTSLLDKQGDTEMSEAAQVTKYSINSEVAETEFTLKLPLGTWVTDSDTKEVYLLRANGKRPILPGEFNGHNYEELLRTEPTKRPIQPPPRRRRVEQKFGPT